MKNVISAVSLLIALISTYTAKADAINTDRFLREQGEDKIRCLIQNGELICKGHRFDGTSARYDDPKPWQKVDVFGPGEAVKKFAFGAAFMCALSIRGKIKCYVYNIKGQLGDGTFTDSFDRWVEVNGIIRASDFSIGYGDPKNDKNKQYCNEILIPTVCAVDEGDSGKVKCWGGIQTGQKINFNPTPVGIPGIQHALAIATIDVPSICQFKLVGHVVLSDGRFGSITFNQGDETHPPAWEAQFSQLPGGTASVMSWNYIRSFGLRAETASYVTETTGTSSAFIDPYTGRPLVDPLTKRPLVDPVGQVIFNDGSVSSNVLFADGSVGTWLGAFGETPIFRVIPGVNHATALTGDCAVLRSGWLQCWKRRELFPRSRYPALTFDPISFEYDFPIAIKSESGRAWNNRRPSFTVNGPGKGETIEFYTDPSCSTRFPGIDPIVENRTSQISIKPRVDLTVDQDYPIYVKVTSPGGEAQSQCLPDLRASYQLVTKAPDVPKVQLIGWDGNSPSLRIFVKAPNHFRIFKDSNCQQPLDNSQERDGATGLYFALNYVATELVPPQYPAPSNSFYVGVSDPYGNRSCSRRVTITYSRPYYLTCKSSGPNRRNVCSSPVRAITSIKPIDPISGDQTSFDQCRSKKTFGPQGPDKIWVDGGCGAVFRLGY